MNKTEESVSLESLSTYDFEPNCESLGCSGLGMPEHPAHWIVLASCGCSLYWCQDRMHRYVSANPKKLWCDRHPVEMENLTLLSHMPIKPLQQAFWG